MNSRKILMHLLESSKADLDFFSDRGKSERERWVVSEFLKVVSVPFQESELQSLEQESKTDVQFREARFQVKELTDPKLQRTREVREIYNSIKIAQTLEQIALPSVANDIPPIGKIYNLVIKMVVGLSNEEKYLPHKSSLDLLIYVTRTRASLVKPPEIEPNDFSVLGWRSVSCVNSKQAVVFYASSHAPEFLRSRTQEVISVSG